jgi:hypothetical protein
MIQLTSSDKVKSEKSLQDETLKNLLVQPLRVAKKKKGKSAEIGETVVESTEKA